MIVMAEQTLAKRKKGRRLRSLENARAFVAGVIRQVEAGTMQEDRARLLLYGAQVLTRVIEAGQSADAEALRQMGLMLQDRAKAISAAEEALNRRLRELDAKAVPDVPGAPQCRSRA